MQNTKYLEVQNPKQEEEEEEEIRRKQYVPVDQMIRVG